MRKIPVLMAMALMSTSISGLALAAEETPKIGIVDMEKALQSVEAGKKAKAQLEKEYTAKKKEFQIEEEAIKKMDAELRKQSLVMSDEARAKKQGELEERFRKFQASTMRAQQEFQQKEGAMTAPIITSLKEIVKKMATDKGFTVILQKSDQTVLYSRDKDELTTEVINAYNKQGDGGDKKKKS